MEQKQMKSYEKTVIQINKLPEALYEWGMKACASQTIEYYKNHPEDSNIENLFMGGVEVCCKVRATNGKMKTKTEEKNASTDISAQQ